MDIGKQTICLKLNKLWQPIGISSVDKTICDLIMGTVKALDIKYVMDENETPDLSKVEYFNPVTWNEWVQLPIYPWQLNIKSIKMTIRVPTIVITSNFDKMIYKKFKNKPTLDALFLRDNGIDGYTGLPLDYNEATIDHIIPRSRGGQDVYENTVLTNKEINNRKGAKLNHEAGLNLKVTPTKPKAVPFHKTIRKIKHRDWILFLNNK